MTNSQSQNLLDLVKTLPPDMFGRETIAKAMVEAAKTIHEQKLILDSLYYLKYTSVEIIRHNGIASEIRLGVEVPFVAKQIVSKYRYPKTNELLACGILKDIVKWDDNLWDYNTLEQ